MSLVSISFRPRPLTLHASSLARGPLARGGPLLRHLHAAALRLRLPGDQKKREGPAESVESGEKSAAGGL